MRFLKTRLSTCLGIGALVIVMSGSLWSVAAHADEANAKRMLKAMSEYVGAQERISFEFDEALGVVTDKDQKLTLVSSGSLTLARPSNIRAKRSAGHADVEMVYDGKTLTVLERTENLYTQIARVGTIDALVDVLREEYGRPLPAADLILVNSYDPLMEDVTDVKDLGIGIVNGVKCVHLAFRKEVLDFEIWIAQGDKPYPCRYTVTSKDIPHSPQFTAQIRNWTVGDAVLADGFSFDAPAGAKKVELKELQEGLSDLPSNFTGAAQ